jgi:TPR repeat protein
LQGQKIAQDRFAQMLVNGDTPTPPQRNTVINWVANQTKPDDTVSLAWLKQQVDENYAIAQGRLGALLIEAGNMDRGIELITLAAERGDAFGQYQLSQAFASGDGVEQDLVTAHVWANLAAARDQAEAKDHRDILSDLMTPDQIEQAQYLASAFVAKN